MGMLKMGVVLNGMTLTALHPAKREYDTQQHRKAFAHMPAVAAEFYCLCFEFCSARNKLKVVISYNSMLIKLILIITYCFWLII